MRSSQRVVLGIDAAWTETEPSGVAVAVETEAGWRLGAVEASYEHFIARADGIDPGEARPRGSKPSAAALLRAAEKLSAWPVALVAIDMPLAPYPIVGRRPCDEAISAAFGAKGAATHSPSAIRPGRISDESRGEFAALGYPLCGQTPARGLIEVYPHAALIQFMREGYRLPYKAEKISKYWPDLAPDERRAKLQSVWARIVKALESRIAGVAAALPLPATDARGWRLKAYEDKLDAVVCAAVAIACVNGKARAYGDNNAAVWVPFAE